MNQTASDLAGVFPEVDDLERLGVLLQSDLDIPLAQLAEVVHAGSEHLGTVRHEEGVLAAGRHIGDLQRARRKVADHLRGIQIEDVVGRSAELPVRSAAPGVAEARLILRDRDGVVQPACDLLDDMLRQALHQLRCAGEGNLLWTLLARYQVTGIARLQVLGR